MNLQRLINGSIVNSRIKMDVKDLLSDRVDTDIMRKISSVFVIKRGHIVIGLGRSHTHRCVIGRTRGTCIESIQSCVNSIICLTVRFILVERNGRVFARSLCDKSRQ